MFCGCGSGVCAPVRVVEAAGGGPGCVKAGCGGGGRGVIWLFAEGSSSGGGGSSGLHLASWHSGTVGGKDMIGGPGGGGG